MITYTSSNPAVATVDQFGKVTALTEGEPTIIRTVSIAINNLILFIIIYVE